VPYINGRYYMNPQYGAAVEGARPEESDDVDDDGITTEPEIELVAADKASQREQPTKKQAPGSMHAPQSQEHKAEIGYGETAGLLPQESPHAPKKASPYDRRTWDPHSAAELQQARTNIMDISIRNHVVHPAKPGNDTISQSVWNDNMKAAANSDGSLPGQHFFIRQHGVGRQRPGPDQGWGQGKPIRSYGPFRNVGGGDAPKGDDTYIDIYNR
jgi:hypothetical protein